jgi:hypothetical protein
VFADGSQLSGMRFGKGGKLLRATERSIAFTLSVYVDALAFASGASLDAACGARMPIPDVTSAAVLRILSTNWPRVFGVNPLH